jgi:hypothetical protein
MPQNQANWRKVLILLSGCVFTLAAGVVFADGWGTNAIPCSSGHCAPVTPWGYTPQQWHRWPYAVYPDMIKPAGAKNGDEVSPPSIEIPPPNKEAEMQTAPPTREPAGGAKSPSTLPGPGTDLMNSPTPAKPADLPKPNDMPPLREAPGAQPPTIDPFAPPTTKEPGNAPTGRSSGVLRIRAQAANLPSSAFAPEKADSLRTPRWSSSESKDIDATPTARIRIGNNVFNRQIAPDQEPDLLLPSLSTRPMAMANSDNRSIRSATGNPLRIDTASPIVQPATYVDPDPTASDDARFPSSAASGTTASRVNPLRR